MTPPRSGLWAAFGLFFFNDTATTEIYTLSLHDALPIYPPRLAPRVAPAERRMGLGRGWVDRKSTRLNSSHMSISYAVVCLKKKNNKASSPRCRIGFSRSSLSLDCPHS